MAWWEIRENSNRQAYKPKHFGFGIRLKLLVGFSLVVVLLAAATFVNIYQIDVSKRYSDQLTNINIPATLANVELSKEIYASLSSLNAWLLTKDKKYKEAFEEDWLNIRSLTYRNDMYNQQTSQKINIQQWIIVKNNLNKLHELQNKLVVSPANSEQNNLILTGEIIPLADSILDTLGTIYGYGPKGSAGIVYQQKLALEASTSKFMNDIRILQINQWAMLIGGILLAIIIATITARAICKPLYSAIHIARELASGKRDLKITTNKNDETGELLTALSETQTSIRNAENKLRDSEAKVQTLLRQLQNRVVQYRDLIEQVANGDLTRRLSVDGHDDLSELGRHLNQMTDGLSKITGEIAGAIQLMGGSLTQVEEAVSAQAASAAEQAAAVTQTVTIIEQIKATSSQTLAKANQLAALADRTREESKKGMSAVEQTTEGMQDIQSKVKAIANSILALTEQTKKIGETTSAVNSLAERSKLLALNASIEAAKAGEAGKGFGVVATEIKDLAEQSQQATSQVQDILEEIQQATEKAVLATEEGSKGVNEGLNLVDQTGQVIRHLSEVIHESSRSNHQIVAAVQQEAAGIEQIAQAMSEINTATDQFVTFTNQTSKVAKQFSEISQQLESSIHKYKIADQFKPKKDSR